MTETSDSARTWSRSSRHGIVVGYDATPAAKVALRWAAAEAARRATPLTVFYVVDFTGLTVDPWAAHVDDWPGPALDAGREVAHEGVSRATSSEPVVAARPLVGTGAPAEALVEQSRTAELVVVGTRGRGEFAAACLGSVSSTVVTHAHCPVVIVRGKNPHVPGPGYPVVVGVDGSASCRRALEVAADIAADAHAPLRVVSAWAGPADEAWMVAYPRTAYPSTTELVYAERASADEAAQEAARRARQLHPGLQVGVLAVEGRPAAALVQAANDAGLLVIGTRGHGAVTSLVLGSVSHGVVHAAHCAVAVVRTRKAPRRSDKTREPVHVTR
ncbi:MAG TPA: universal stress protein [Kineosporiaceae bacterium]|nr:universal stress protein [Kineosporiaceae bacterium]